MLHHRGIKSLIVCGVTTEVCVNTTVREANDRGYECVVLADCVGSYFPEFHRVALEMIKAQGGIFGWVSDSKAALAALRRRRSTKVRRASKEENNSNDDHRRISAETLDAGRLERVLRLRHQHSRQHAGADRPVALRAEDAGRDLFGRILPALGLMMCLSTFYYAWLAYRLAQKTGRDDVCALPSGVSVPHMFVVTFVIMLPITIKTGDPLKGWAAGLVWVFFQSFLLMPAASSRPHPQDHAARRAARRARRHLDHLHLDAPGARNVHDAGDRPRLLRHHPRELVRRVQISQGHSGGSRGDRRRHADRLGRGAVRLQLRRNERSKPHGALANFGFSVPLPAFGTVFSGFEFLGIILVTAIPFGIYDLVEAMDNVESAEAAGDAYPTTRVLTADGVVSLIGCLMGNPFINAVYIGHPGWKAMGGRIGYSAATGVMVIVSRGSASSRDVGADPAGRDLADPALHRHADRRAGLPGDAAYMLRRSCWR